MAAAVAISPSTAHAGTVPVGGILTPRAERMIRIGSLGSAIVIAVCAMVLSYAGLHDLALDAQIPSNLALLVPIMVDGLQFVGSLGVIYSTLSGLRSWYPWTLMLMGVSISAWGNWQAAPDVMTAKLLHAAAPVILALVLEELLRVMRHKVSAYAHAAATEVEDAGAGATRSVGSDAVTTVGVEPAVPILVSSEDVVVAADDQRVPVGAGHVTHPVTHPAPESIKTSEPEQPAASADGDSVTADVSKTTDETETETWKMRERIVSLSELRGNESRPAEARDDGDEDSDGDSEGDDDENTLPPYPATGTLKEQISAVLEQDDSIPAARIARVMEREPSYVRKLVREVKREMSETPRRPHAAPTQPTRPQDDSSESRDLRSIDPFSVGSSVEYAAR